MSPARAAETSLSLVGQIYDSALDPALWPSTVRAIREAMDCATAQMFYIDTTCNRMSLLISEGIAQEWLDCQDQHHGEIIIVSRKNTATSFDPDAPLVVSRVLSREDLSQSRYVAEWARPQGLVDVIQVSFVQTPTRLGGVGFGRHERVGEIQDRDVALFRTLIPHLRRAVQIGDLLHMRPIKADILTAALDNLSFGLLVVDSSDHIVHASRAAQKLLDEGVSLLIVNGRLSCPDRAAANRLTQAIRSARTMAPAEAGGYFGINLPSTSDAPCLAHVMPLLSDELRQRAGATAAALVFVTRADNHSLRLDCMAAAFDLSPGEMNVLALLASGRSLVDVAAALGIAESTARTHVKNLHRKTGVERQSELVALIHRLAPPVAGH